MTYLISIPSYHLIDLEIKKIITENDYIIFNMAKISIKEIIEEANYYSLNGEKKYIVINNANFFGTEKISEEDSDILIKYLNNPVENTTLIFTTQYPIDLRKKITKEIKTNYNLINIAKFNYKDYELEINKYVKSKGYDIEYKCINYLINNSYDNLDIIFNELDKIILYYNKKTTIKYSDLIKTISNVIDNNNFHFVNAVIDKNLKLAYNLYNDLKIYKVEPIILINLLAREYRLMYYVKKMYQNNNNFNEICNKLKLQDWQINKIYNNTLKYTYKEIEKNLVDLCKIDTYIKKGIWDKDSALISFLLESCI